MSLQEKFQITVPAKEEVAGNEWQDWTEAKVRREHQDNHDVQPAGLRTRLNKIPSTDLHDNVTTDMPLVLAGTTDVTNLVSDKALGGVGFVKQEMKGTDDQYTGEHMDLFYGDAGGFVERNNYMDRE